MHRRSIWHSGMQKGFRLPHPYLLSLPLTTTARSSRVHVHKAFLRVNSKTTKSLEHLTFSQTGVPSSNLKIAIATSFCQSLIPWILDPETSVSIIPLFIKTIQSLINKLNMNKNIKLINPATLYVASLYLHSLRFSFPYSVPPACSSLTLCPIPRSVLQNSAQLCFPFIFLPSSKLTTFSSSFCYFFSSIPQNSFGRDRGRAKDNCEGNGHVPLSRFEAALRKENKNLHIDKLVKLYISYLYICLMLICPVFYELLRSFPTLTISLCLTTLDLEKPIISSPTFHSHIRGLTTFSGDHLNLSQAGEGHMIGSEANLPPSEDPPCSFSTVWRSHIYLCVCRS